MIYQLLTAVSAFSTIAISSYYRRRARRETGTIPRRREGGALMAVRLFVALPLFLSVLLYITAPSVLAWAAMAMPDWIRWAGAGLSLSSIPMSYWVFSTIGNNVSETVLTKAEHRLIIHGPYRFIRHPLYTTGLMLFTGIGLMNRSWLVLGFCAITWIGVLAVVIPREEAHLVSRFGDQYLALIRRTGRLWPRVRV